MCLYLLAPKNASSVCAGNFPMLPMQLKLGLGKKGEAGLVVPID